MKKVTGIGGVFFKNQDAGPAIEWYRKHLGIDAAEWGGFAFQWTEKERPDQTGYTVWAAFSKDGDHIPAGQAFMINYRVADLDGLVADLKAAGVEVLGDVESHPNGKFAWILDGEGRKVELWEPVPSAEDPYL